ncbi:hypothetical protein [Atopobium fossor]|uniref:hypothetical protein n=1 Tax=Atopobium fossor TaxID=39487 RepID=UPI00047F6193|nr:hypothetical protein [Atopobium fossor]
MLDNFTAVLFGNYSVSKHVEKQSPKNPKPFGNILVTKGDWKLEKSSFMNSYFMRHPKHGGFILSAHTDTEAIEEFNSRTTNTDETEEK